MSLNLIPFQHAVNIVCLLQVATASFGPSRHGTGFAITVDLANVSRRRIRMIKVQLQGPVREFLRKVCRDKSARDPGLNLAAGGQIPEREKGVGAGYAGWRGAAATSRNVGVVDGGSVLIVGRRRRGGTWQ